MQKVVLTIDNTKNAYILLQLIKQFDFVHSIELSKQEVEESSENEIFSDDFAENMYLEDLQMTVKEFREQTLQDEKEHGMSKEDFFKSMKEWRETIEK